MGEEPQVGEEDSENPAADSPGSQDEADLLLEEGRGGGGGQPKVDVCHITGNGQYNLINIAQPAVPAHIRHGDALPFEEVPTQPGLVFDAACVPTVISIDIEKSTAGADADTAPGPELVPGDAVDWTYVVTNDGGIDLVNISVVDDQGVAVSCPTDALAASATMSCDGSGVVVEGQYANLGTATGESTGGFAVTDSDPSHYLGRIPVPGISVEKATNGVDADTPDLGPLLVVGDPVTWTYVITNTGEVPLTDIELVDDDLTVAPSCPQTTLDPNETMTCTASGQVVDGPYANLGEVTGSHGPDPDDIVTDTDPSHYTGQTLVPAISVEKATNGVDADTPELGPLLLLDDPVTWTYVVTNTGDLPLTDVELVDDDLAVAPSCPQTTLDPGESMTCTASGQAIDGPYVNLAEATGSYGSAPDEVVTDTDPSHYTGSRAAIQVEKSVNGFDADVAPGPEVQVGDPLAIQYVVSNLGSDTLTNVGVVDSDPAVTVSCPQSTLASGASMTCTGAADAVEGQQSSTGTASGDFGATTITDDDPAFYVGVDFTELTVAIDIEKATNLQDADDQASGPALTVGTTVTWTYVVTNTGEVALADISVADDDTNVSVVCPPEGVELAPGASVTCTATGTVIAGDYDNTGTATGTSAQGTTATDSDMSHYTGVVASGASVSIEKATNGNDSDSVPGANITVGTPVEWQYLVVNTGDTALVNIVVSDDQGVSVTCPQNFLLVGGSMTCFGFGTAAFGPYANIGTVTASPQGGGADVTDSDPSHYTGVGADASIDIEKTTNGAQADNPGDPDVPSLTPGATVNWSYVITNTGQVPLTGVTVEDDQSDVTVVCDGGIPDPFAAGATFTCSATGVAEIGPYVNIGRATGTHGPSGVVVSDQDSSRYVGTGVVGASVAIEKLTNGEDADQAPGPTVTQGDPVSWTYIVTNDGDVPLNNISVGDNKLGSICTITGTQGSNALDPGQSETCTASGVASLGLYQNVATVVAFGGLTEVTASDVSHYTGVPLPTIDIEKATCDASGACSDADAAPGPSFVVGALVSWQYVVTNTSEIAIDNIVVTDSQGVTVICPATSLASGAAMTCTGGGPNDTAQEGQYSNVGSVTGVAEDGRSVTDSDVSHYLGTVPDPGLVIQKSTNGFDADSPPGPTITVGAPVTWTYAVTNTGNVALYVTVTDDQFGSSFPNGGCTLFNNTTLAPGATLTCTHSGAAVEGLNTNVGTADGRLVFGGPVVVTDADTSHYTGEPAVTPEPSIDIEKFTNGIDTGDGPGPNIVVGTPITWTYVVTNTGNVALNNVIVKDDSLLAPTVCTPGTLAPQQTVTCSANGVAVLGPYVNTGVASGDNSADPSGRGVTDSDDSHYVGVPPTGGSDGPKD